MAVLDATKFRSLTLICFHVYRVMDIRLSRGSENGDTGTYRAWEHHRSNTFAAFGLVRECNKVWALLRGLGLYYVGGCLHTWRSGALQGIWWCNRWSMRRHKRGCLASLRIGFLVCYTNSTTFNLIYFVIPSAACKLEFRCCGLGSGLAIQACCKAPPVSILVFRSPALPTTSSVQPRINGDLYRTARIENRARQAKKQPGCLCANMFIAGA